MLKQKNAAVKGLTGGIEGLFKKWKVNASYIYLLFFTTVRLFFALFSR